MPNWCSTAITIKHDNREKLNELSEMIGQWTSKNYKDNGFGLSWLGNIVGNSGVGTVDENIKTDLHCRGWMTNDEISDGQLVIQTETAWVPMLKMWQMILEKYLPDAELIYEAEECGCELFCTNNKELCNRYVIDVCDSDKIESNWNATEDEVIEVLQELCNSTETSIEKLLDKFNKMENENISIQKWEFSEPNEWE